MDNTGAESKAKTLVFSLPVTETAGMRLTEEEFPETDESADTDK